MKILLILIYFMAIGSVTEGQAQKPIINHLALHVQDLAKSAAFYQHIIGLDTIPEPFHDGNHVWFSVGSAQLHLIGRAKEIAVQSKQSHLCFSVSSVDAFIKRLQQANVIYEDVKGEIKSITVRTDGVKQIYFKDPDGYWIEINDAKN
jgi:lactoylglutathione lyase